MYGINKRYPAYKAKMELRNRMRRAQEKDYLERMEKANRQRLHGGDDKRYAPPNSDNE